MGYLLSEPAEPPTKYPGRRALKRLVTPTTACVTDDGRHAVAADVPWLATDATGDVMEWPALYLRSQSRRFWAAAGNMARDVAQVADWFIFALPSYMSRLTAVVACPFIGAVNSNVARLKTIVA
jgi:hypothetical protein